MNLDTQTLVHVGTELAIFGCFAFWTSRRIGGVDSKVEELTKKISSYEELTEQLKQMVLRHETVIRQMLGIPPDQGPRPQSNLVGQTLSQPPPRPPPPKAPGSSQNQPPSPSKGFQQSQSQSQSQSPSQSSEVYDSPDFSPEALDDLLQTEIDELQPIKVIEIDTRKDGALKSSKRISRSSKPGRSFFESKKKSSSIDGSR